MNIARKTLAEKQAFWNEQLPLFKEAYWLPEHFELLEFNMEAGNFVVRGDIDPVFERDADELYHRINTGWSMWKRAVNLMQNKLEGCVVVPHGVLDLTRFMCKTWSEVDKFVYKNCNDIGEYPVIQGTQNQLNLSRIGEQQINANEINKGVKWLLEAARGGNEY